MTENTDTIGILIELLLHNGEQVPDSTGKTKLLFCVIWQNLLRDIKQTEALNELNWKNKLFQVAQLVLIWIKVNLPKTFTNTEIS
jgi:hypothetical protein